ncbi:MAG: hypothetical protein V3V14_04820, partial [Saprospiraceae bacterium]
LNTIESMQNKNLITEKGEDLNYLKYIRGKQYLKVLQRLNVIKKDKSLKPSLAVTQDIINTQITPHYRISARLIIDYLGKRTR